MEIKGTYATAVCFARTVEEKAAEQIRTMCSTPVAEGSKVRIMPDVHAGKGCTIGTTMTIHGRAVPNVVGVDIGCGMYTVRLNTGEIDCARVDEAAHFIPSGQHVWDEPMEPFPLEELRCFSQLRHPKRLACSLGTLGGGNHFIEIDRASDGECYLVIHSGSRNLGKQVAEYYQQLAIDWHEGKPRLTVDRDALIAQLKAEGRHKEIQAALRALDKPTRALQVPASLCWLEGDYLADYLHDVELCQRFALRSRERMAQMLLERTGMTGQEGFHTIHNYIDTAEMILRKGAIAAHKGERVLIPINMRDGSILALGKGNPDWNFSAPHGAGRVMSRMAARSLLTMEEYRASMEGIYTTSVSADTLDEAPMAYKSLEEIVDAVQEAVDILDIIRPIYNFKAAD
ncbi:MAG: RtcB family protein [Aristaeellaceae bacterium]